MGELLCNFVEIDSNTFTCTCDTITYLIGEVGGFRKSNLDIDEGNLDIDEGALDSEFDLTPR